MVIKTAAQTAELIYLNHNSSESCYCNESQHVCTQMQGSGYAARGTKSRHLQYPNDATRVAAKPVAWLHSTGCNEIQLLYRIVFPQ